MPSNQPKSVSSPLIAVGFFVLVVYALLVYNLDSV
jgi:hypothetical protein